MFLLPGKINIKGSILRTKFSVFSFVLYILMGLLFLYAPWVWSQQETREGRGAIRISVVAVNPSETKTQKIPVKTYLPSEVMPNDVLNSGNLKIEFDTGSSIYYLYSDDVELKPKETRAFQVELRDVWVIPRERLDALRSQMKAIVERMEGTEDYEMAQKLAEAIYKDLDTVERTQNDDSLSTQSHIGAYRNNSKTIEQIKEDIARLEKQVSITGSPPVPEVLENPQLNTNSPTKNTTWMIIFIIMVFMGMLAMVFFLTWHTQARFTKNVISETRDFVFPKNDDLSQKDMKKEDQPA